MATRARGDAEPQQPQQGRLSRDRSTARPLDRSAREGRPHPPQRGEVVTDDSGVSFEVIDADARRIKRVRVRTPETPTGESLA